jgi:hypothetical protein
VGQYIETLIKTRVEEFVREIFETRRLFKAGVPAEVQI